MRTTKDLAGIVKEIRGRSLQGSEGRKTRYGPFVAFSEEKPVVLGNMSEDDVVEEETEDMSSSQNRRGNYMKSAMKSMYETMPAMPLPKPNSKINPKTFSKSKSSLLETAIVNLSKTPMHKTNI